jgi:hypothetical protein
MSETPSYHVLARLDRRPELLNAIVAEFRRQPTLALTMPQAGRLWSLEPGTCAQLLDCLVEEAVLARRSDGRYVMRAVA